MAAGVVLAAGFGGVPAAAVTPSPSPVAPSPGAMESPTAGGGLSEAALSEAALRDLGMTAAEFSAAGQLGKQAADVAAALRGIPGYLSTRIEGGRILVTGSGQDLEAAVTRLRNNDPAVTLDMVTLAPEPGPPPSDAPSTPAAEVPTDAGITAVPETHPAPGTEFARSTQQLFQAYLRDVGPAGLQSVAFNGRQFVIRTGGVTSAEATLEGGRDAAALVSPVVAAEGKISAAEFVARYANVELDAGAPLAPEADVPGGLGYAADTGYICSTGFSAFDPAGLPAVLTAGHCTDDGAARSATLHFQGLPAGLLGNFGFSQFGGTGNSSVLRPGNVADPGNVGTDIAVIHELRADLNPMPAASTWGNPSEPDPDVKVIGVAAPVLGMPVCRSGRTSAWSCGTIDEVGIFVVPGRNYPADPLDLRAFTGFLSFDVQSSGGDSGGPWLSGNYAVGTHSAGEDASQPNQAPPVNFAVATTLEDALGALPGFQLELFLNKPTVSSPAPGATFDAGQTVTGMVAAAPASAVAAGSKVRVTVEGKAPFEVPVEAGGAWSFTAPAGSGPLRFTAETVNGFSASGASAFEFAAAPAALPAEPPAQTETPAAVPPASGAPASESAAAVVVRPLGDSRSALAVTGVSGLLLAAGIAAAALVVGGALLVLVRRRKRRT